MKPNSLSGFDVDEFAREWKLHEAGLDDFTCRTTSSPEEVLADGFLHPMFRNANTATQLPPLVTLTRTKYPDVDFETLAELASPYYQSTKTEKRDGTGNLFWAKLRLKRHDGSQFRNLLQSKGFMRS